MSQTPHTCAGCGAEDVTTGTAQHREHTVPLAWAVVTVAPTSGKTTSRKVCGPCLEKLEGMFR